MNKIANIKLLNEVECVISGLSPREYQFLKDKFGFYQKGYFFAPHFKLGKWDGKRYFFTENGLSYVKILDEVIPYIKQMGYKITLTDKRTVSIPDFEKIDENFFIDNGVTLGEHQKEGVNSIIENKGGILIAGTGAGKSFICGALSKLITEHKMRVIVIVPRGDLITQTRKEFESLGISTGEYSGDKKDLNSSDIVISTWQAIQHNMGIMASFHAVIVDECHGVSGSSLFKILNSAGQHIALRIGVTGTLPKDKCDAMCIKTALGTVVYEVPASKLIQAGWLANLHIECHVLSENMMDIWEKYQISYPKEAENLTYEQFKNEYFPDYTSEKDFLNKNNNRKKFISTFVDTLRLKEKSNTFILVNSVSVGKSLQKLIPNSYFVQANDEGEVRREIYDLFNTQDDVVAIATYQLASTGLNIKRIYNLVMVDPSKSFIQVIQSIGRGLRKADDKDSVIVYEISSDLKYGSSHRKQRQKYYKQQKYNYSVKKIDYWKVFD